MPTISRTTLNKPLKSGSFKYLPPATRRANGKFLADGVFSISTDRLREAGACGMAAGWVMDALTGKTAPTTRQRTVKLNEKVVRRFAASTQAHRIEWIAYRLHREGFGLSKASELSVDAYGALREKFSYWAGQLDKRDKVEMIFAMLEAVARKRGLLPK